MIKMYFKISLISALTIAFFFSFIHLSRAHGDHEHEHEEELSTSDGPNYFSTEVSSAKYEVLLRYAPITPGEEAHLTLFISDYESNRPVNDIRLKLSSSEDSSIKFEIEPEGEGTWHIHANFPEEKEYSVNVQITSDEGSETLTLKEIMAGKELDEHHDHAEEHWYSSTFFLMFLSMIAGILLLWIFQKLTGKRVDRAATVIALIALFIPIKPSQLCAHEDDSHSGKTKLFSNVIEVPKESQFLLDVFTQKVKSGSEIMVQNFFGTVVPSSSGQAIVTAPQTGKIISLHTTVGSRVSAGQTLAVMEGFIDASAAVTYQAEKNNLQAEYDAAQKELNRLNSISDIAAKKELDEAEARMKKTKDNLELFQTRSATRIELKSPISGVMDNFTLSTGTAVTQSEVLFTVVNPGKIYVDAQVYGDAAKTVKAAKKFTARNSDGKVVEANLLAIPQTVHESNQSQHVLFEVNNPDNTFKIGEFVTIQSLIPTEEDAIVIPATSITEVDGRACVFVKKSAEHYELRFVNESNNNGTTVNITKGLEVDERVVINATYQMKMIYLNQ